MKKAATDQLSVAAFRLFARRSRSAVDVNNSTRSWIDEHRLTIHVNVAVVIIRHRSLLGRHFSRPRWTSLEPGRPGVFLARVHLGVFNLPRRDPHDMDSIADHVGGALFAFW